MPHRRNRSRHHSRHCREINLIRRLLSGSPSNRFRNRAGVAAGVAVGIRQPKHPRRPVPSHKSSLNAVAASSVRHSHRRNLSSRNNAAVAAMNNEVVVSHSSRVVALAVAGHVVPGSCIN